MPRAKAVLDRGLYEGDSNGRYLHLNPRHTDAVAVLGLLGTWGWELAAGTLNRWERVWMVLKRPAAAVQLDLSEGPAQSTHSGPDSETWVKVYARGGEAQFRLDEREATAHGWYPVERRFEADGSIQITFRKAPPSESASRPGS